MDRHGRHTRAAGLVFAAFVLFALPAGANAATLKSTSGGLKYTVGAGETADAVLSATGRTLTIEDAGVASITGSMPSGCALNTADVGISVTCPLVGERTVTLALGDGNDFVDGMTIPKRLDLVATTGAGTNLIAGGAGDDRLTGAAGDDTLYGGPGTDVLLGGEGSNWLRGNGGNDTMRSGSGIDFIFGDGGDDTASAGADVDYLVLGSGDDYADAGAGNDDIEGNKGDDGIFGGGGDDELRGGQGEDVLDGGAGDDLLRSRDGEADVLRCGAGDDVARVDAGEVDFARRSCETVKQTDVTPGDPQDEDVITSLD